MNDEYNKSVIIGGLLSIVASQIILRYIDRRKQKKRMQQLRKELIAQVKTKY